MKEGDRKTKFFDRVAIGYKRKNFIGMLSVNGDLVEEEEIFSKEIVDYYEKIFYEEEDRRPLLDGLEFQAID